MSEVCNICTSLKAVGVRMLKYCSADEVSVSSRVPLTGPYEEKEATALGLLCTLSTLDASLAYLMVWQFELS